MLSSHEFEKELEELEADLVETRKIADECVKWSWRILWINMAALLCQLLHLALRVYHW